ncbi:type II secretion system F family protein [Candidatus Pelagibacter bacterium]|jgi:type IV pilus assembly protein PilC|nr:type II secretion system F family protein [Candidatus Pelagibacter bacterium]MDB2378955.1 type II secretion system F family protein [Candidatus Pelagibacter bacterium]MDB4217288.1 type II secretion system F family protein [Candidatus Pelagibacter sp.]|tara:strand:+ start:1386 stop:2618 length:1233 start_codon:yes stop_codon:yes gene_type:complete
MLNFEYKGISQGKYVEGEIEALNNAEAAHKLKDQKVIITKLKEAKKKKLVSKKEKTSFSFGTGIKAQEILIFCKQFATMLRAGLPVLNTLEMLEGQTTRPPMKKVIQTIKKDLESGNALSKCFEKHPKIFDTVVVNLIKAGEASGKLDTFLQKIVISLEKREKIKSQIKSALFYPGVLFSVAILVTVFMLMNVVPTFVNMYEGMGMGDDLPTPTAVIMSMSEFVRSSGGLFLLIFIILFVVGFKYLISKNYGVKKAWHQIMLKLPVFGNLINKSILAKVSLVLGNLNQAGVDLIESIDIAKSVTDNVIVIEALENIKKGVFSGETLTDLFNKEKIFPPTFSQLISVGEQTGSLDEMFGSVAIYYEEEFDVAVANLASLIEPIMIVFMGITIGGLMLAMYAPIFNVGAIIG